MPPKTNDMKTLSKKDQQKIYWIGKYKYMKKPRIRIYKKSGDYEYFDITKGLSAFNDKCIQLQYIWVLSMGVKL